MDAKGQMQVYSRDYHVVYQSFDSEASNYARYICCQSLGEVKKENAYSGKPAFFFDGGGLMANRCRNGGRRPEHEFLQRESIFTRSVLCFQRYI